MIEKFNAEYIPGGAAQNTARVTQVCSIDIIIMLVYIMYYYNGQIIKEKKRLNSKITGPEGWYSL